MNLPGVRVALWDDEPIAGGDDRHVASIRFLDRGAFYRTLINPGFHFPEGYAQGRIAIEGDLVGLLELIYQSTARPARPRRLRAINANTLRGSRRNIHHHYDIGNAFYKLWLDDQLLYTCAYYDDPAMDLEAAQIAKMDHVCRKLELQPGQRVIEAGCGWGALAMHMARHYGVHVRAFNISHEQIRYAQERARALGLGDRVEFIEDDYRNIPRHPKDACDAFVSVGMLEHVGVQNYPELGRTIDRVLRRSPGARGLIHTIGRHRLMNLSTWIRARIFPGAEPPTLRQMMDIFEPFDLCALDVENIRLHYAQTLRHWLERFEANCQHVAQMFDDRFVRTWRMYLAGSVAAFTAGTLQLFQVVFARNGDNRTPWTRKHVYARDAASASGLRESA